MGEEEEEEEEEEGEKRGVSAKTWSRLTHQPRGLQAPRRAKVEQEEEVEEEEEEERRSSEYKQLQGAPHHSKEESPEEEATQGLQHSPEETELRMMARREPEPRDEEGSASRKTEVMMSQFVGQRS